MSADTVVAMDRPEEASQRSSPATLSLESKQLIGLCILTLACTLFAFWPLMKALPDVWFGFETYYAHGAIVPLCAAFIVWDQWPRIRSIPVRGSNWALIPLLLLLALLWPTLRSEMHSLMSVLLLAVLSCSTWFIAGAKWARSLFVATWYLIFGLPVFGIIIDRATQPLQHISANIAYAFLQIANLHPVKIEPTKFLLNEYILDIGIPCSGLKTLLAVTAITVFFIIVAKLRLRSNLILAALVMPLSLIVNGFRIMLIGVVGDQMGDSAARHFHDYSGYIALIICSAALYYVTRALGWKSS